MAILYVETNFVVGVARGQDPDAAALLGVPRAVLRLALPSVCVMETWSRYERLAGEHLRFEGRARSYINDLRGDVGSHHAQAMRGTLTQSIAMREGLVEETRDSFKATLSRLVRGPDEPDGTARVELVALTTQVLATWLAGEIMLSEPTDALILDIVLDHATRCPEEAKGFLSANKTDFDTPDVRHALRRAGITHYFKETAHALGWVRAGCRA